MLLARAPDRTAAHVPCRWVIQQWCFAQLLPCHIMQAASAAVSALLSPGTCALWYTSKPRWHKLAVWVLPAGSPKKACGSASAKSAAAPPNPAAAAASKASIPAGSCFGSSFCTLQMGVTRGSSRQQTCYVLGPRWDAVPHSTRVQSGRACCLSCVSTARAAGCCCCGCLLSLFACQLFVQELQQAGCCSCSALDGALHSVTGQLQVMLLRNPAYSSSRARDCGLTDACDGLACVRVSLCV